MSSYNAIVSYALAVYVDVVSDAPLFLLDFLFLFLFLIFLFTSYSPLFLVLVLVLPLSLLFFSSSSPETFIKSPQRNV